MLRRMALVRADVSEERIASIFREEGMKNNVSSNLWLKQAAKNHQHFLI
jgi:hypothetical protein